MTVELTAQHLEVMRAIDAGENPEIFPMQRKFLRRHGLIVPVDPPRPIRTTTGRVKAPPPRAHSLTDDGKRALAEHSIHRRTT